MSEKTPMETPPETGPADSPAPAPEEQRSMRPFFVLWAGQTLSLVGSSAVQFALIWWVTATTGSATILAAASFVGLAPQVALGPVIGALVDRWNRKTVMLVADGAVAAASLVLAGLFAAGIASTSHVLALLFVRAVGGAFHMPAMMASTTLMVPAQHLTRIQGLNQGLQGLLLIVGAPLGAFLYQLMPMEGVMLVDVATAMIAILPLIFIAIPQPERSEQVGSSVWQEMVAGFQYLRVRRGHLILIGLSSAINLVLVPAFSLLPLFVLERLHGDATQLGWISSTLGVGMLAGGILLSVWGGFSRRIITTLAGLMAIGLAVIAVGLTPADNFPWMLGAMFSVGLIVPLINGPAQAILQLTIAPEYQGRVFTLLGSLAGGMAPLGLVLAAPVAEIAGVDSWYLAGGVTCLLMGGLGFLAPSLLRIEQTAAE